ncbi:methyl-accepting chemotaxis protein [Fodinicurvata sp. EGI_FJ10296]|uniref:methyl-accepting chemotaxis protein n=1 Tax=Fodinicurvata sp. EGI_FJ10296 TaxID=3231908 RepID=UPI0034519046
MTSLDQIRQRVAWAFAILVALHLPIVIILGWAVEVTWMPAATGTAILSALLTATTWTAPRATTTHALAAVSHVAVIAILVAMLNGHPWQIDMHMYFFAGIALIGMFCNWRLIVMAGGLIAVHHLGLNILIPAAVFPGGGDIGRVLLHALIVVVEVGALSWLAVRLVAAFAGAEAAIADARAAQAETARLAAEQADYEATIQRTATQLRCEIAAGFEADIGGIVREMAIAGRDLQGAARGLTDVAENTRQGAAGANRSGENAAVNIDAIALASDELLQSISEIARQINHSETGARDTAAKAGQAAETVRQLGERTAEISSIVDLIDDIAERTNLLALNATIEAARAGEAGRGFAIVAGEVKALARQTAEATRGIQRQVEDVQAVSKQVEAAISTIDGGIRAVLSAVGAISSAAEEQEAATREIANKVQAAADGTRDVSAAIAGVDAVAVTGEERSGVVLQASTALNDISGRLRAAMTDFVDRIKAA